MTDQGNIPTLTDIIERGFEIKISDLGLDEDLHIAADDDATEIDATEIDATEPELGLDAAAANALGVRTIFMTSLPPGREQAKNPLHVYVNPLRGITGIALEPDS